MMISLASTILHPLKIWDSGRTFNVEQLFAQVWNSSRDPEIVGWELWYL